MLKHRTVTVVGPQPSTVIKLGNLMDPTERFVGAATFDAAGAPLNLELSVEQADGTPARLRFDAPDGIATVELYVTSQKTGFRDEYINMVDADSCRVLIDAVYEPTFEHLGDEFGRTILGFFTDEPGFMNEKGTALDDASTSSLIGRGDMALPWSDELARRLHEALGASWLTKLHGLWTREADGARVRHTYMDIATQLYRACFDEQIGDWCREHGVMHIGHVIEDKSCHTRLGQAPGTTFARSPGRIWRASTLSSTSLPLASTTGATATSTARGTWSSLPTHLPSWALRPRASTQKSRGAAWPRSLAPSVGTRAFAR